MNNQKLILHINTGKEEVKAMLISEIIQQMQEIEYEMDKLYDFGVFPMEAYKSMWDLLKKIMEENFISKK